MPLTRQVISVPMAGALDTKTDPKLTPIGKFLELENAYRVRNGELVKRYGFESLGTTVEPSGTVTDGRKMALLGDELNVITNKSMYTYSDDNDTWVLKGPLETLSIDDSPVVANSYQQSTADSATSGNIALYAYEDTRGGVRYTIIDRLSNSTIVADSSLAASAVKPKVIALNNKIMVFAQTANTLTCYIFNAKQPTSAFSTLTIGSDSDSLALYDIIIFNNAILFGYIESSAKNLKLGFVTALGVLGLPSNGYPAITTNATVVCDMCMTIFADDESRFNVAYARQDASNTKVRHIGLYADLSTVWLADAELASYAYSATTKVRNITGFQKNTLSHIYWDKDNSDKWLREVTDTHRNINTGVVAPGAGSLRSVSLAGKIFYTDDNGFVPVVYYSTTQPTMFLLRNDGDISAKMLTAISSGETAKSGHLPSMTELATNKWVFPTQYKSLINSVGNDKFGLTGITEVMMDFDDPNICFSGQLGDNTLISSGYLQCYDGMSIFESGFHLYPDHITLAQLAGGVLNGTYNYIVVYEWIDNNGQKHCSAPSIGKQITVSSGKGVSITLPYLYITDRKNGRSDVEIAVYRTTESGTLFFKIDKLTYNNTTAGSFSVTINDNTMTDANLVLNERLYTTGNVVENISPPAVKYIERFKNRMFLAGLEEGNTIWYSKEHQPNTAIEFTDTFAIKVDDTGGVITALKSLDDKLIIFKKSTIFVLMGDGPLPTGAQNQFNVPQAITTDVGAVSQSSVVKVRDGVMFKSTKGIYLLDRGMNVSYVGADVEQWNDLDITSATVIDDLNQVRFTTAEGRCLVYDLFFKQWSTFTNIDAIDSLNWQGKFIFLKSSAEIWREVKGTYTDNGQPIITSYVLSLMQFAQVQGLQRIYKINVLGEYRGEHGLKLEVGYDFREFYEERFIVQPEGVLYDSIWGDDSVWGEAGTTWGGNADGVYQFQIRPRTQKCQALRLKVSDFFTSTGTAGFAFSNISAEVGIEPNIARLSKTKIIAP